MSTIRGRLRLTFGLLQKYRELMEHEKELTAMKANKFGLHNTDYTCLSLLLREDLLSPGDISTHTGLTTGATSTMLERLEKGGYVQRIIHPQDRRKSLVKLRGRKIQRIEELEQTLHYEKESLLSQYSLEELAIITDFLERSLTLSTEQQAKVSGKRV